MFMVVFNLALTVTVTIAIGCAASVIATFLLSMVPFLVAGTILYTVSKVVLSLAVYGTLIVAYNYITKLGSKIGSCFAEA